MRRLSWYILLSLCVALVTATSASAAPGAGWTIAAVSVPTAFAPGATYSDGGPEYLIEAVNVGGGSTSGTFKVTDRLPETLEVAKGHPVTGAYGHRLLEAMACSSAGKVVTCKGTGSSLAPGEEVSIKIPVNVKAGAPSQVNDEASIEGGGAAAALTSTTTPIQASSPSFGFLDGPAGLFGSTTTEEGFAATQAGSHPYQSTISGIGLPTIANDPGHAEVLAAGGGVRDVVAELPRGVVVNPGATSSLCTEEELETPMPISGATSCPDASQVGTIGLTLSLGAGLAQSIRAVYNMVPPAGAPAELGFEIIEGTYEHLVASVRSDGTFILTAGANDLLAKVAIGGVRPQLWGDPSAESHDGQRGACLVASSSGATCPVARTHKAFISLPSSCGGPLTTNVSIDSWEQPGAWIPAGYQSTDLEGTPVGIEGCGNLQFEPTVESHPTTGAGESPSGLDFDLHQPQHEGSEELATANLKDATVSLPAGLALNPSASAGLEGCSPAQIGVATGPGVTPIRYLEEPAHCPDASKLGTVEVTTPLLKEGPEGERVPRILNGSVYLAKPFDNPFGSLLAIYLAVKDEKTGIVAKLAGKVTADQTTGRLTTSFEESPELPLEDVRLHLFPGERAALTTPLACGTHTTTTTLTPWSTPEGADAYPSDSFDISSGCASSEAAAPKAASLTAGTVSPLSGAYSPFVLRVSRPDGSQHITGIETTLPAGLLGKLAGVAYCPESGIAQAISREKTEQGKLEQSSPSCPQSSEVGTVNVTAGSGNSPIPVSGHAYLAGPYKGAPLSLVVIVPAVAGPFDLGTVVDRVALNVGEYDARIHAVADALPTIREGIPLDVRSIELKLDRPSFTLNPTSCEAMQIEGSVSTQAGQSQTLANRFQVGECGRLAFKPKLQLTLKGPTKKTGHPSVKAVVTYPKQGAYANIARAQVNLPHSEFLDQGNIAKACTKVVLAQRACPAKSIYGKAKAWSPLLEKPLEGPVYLVGGYGYKLPALVAELNGQIRVLLVGKVDSGKNHGIRNTFEAVPDAPVSRFVLELKGGKKYGLLENSENVCRRPQKAGLSFRAQNGKVLTSLTRISNSCGGGKGGKGKPKKDKPQKHRPKK